jgi:excisionase family DNA binding protein
MNNKYSNNSCVPDSILLSRAEAAALLRVSQRTLWNISHRDLEIPYVKYGKLVRYRRADLEAWALRKLLPLTKAVV